MSGLVVLICPNCLRTKNASVVGVEVEPLPEGTARWVRCPDCSTTLWVQSEHGELDLGIVRDPLTFGLRNNLTVFHEEFTRLLPPEATEETP